MADTTTQAEELYHQIASEMPGAKEGKMFGALCLKAPNGKALAIFRKGDMVFKLEGQAQEEALSLDGAKIFDPMGGRPMGGWVQVPFDHGDRWGEFARKALAYVRTIK